MQRVYLDQNKWVDLARARTGKPGGAQYLEAYEAAKAAAAEGRASFPLSAAHYFEIHKRGSVDSRFDVAFTMARISRLDAIAPPHIIVPWEIETALINVMGLSAEPPPPLKMFGTGANHALGTSSFTFEAPTHVNGVAVPTPLRQRAQHLGQRALEMAVLADQPSSPDLRLKLNELTTLTGTKFVDGQNEVRDLLTEMGARQLSKFMIATAFRDIIDPLMAIAQKLGLDVNTDIFDKGPDLLVPLLEAMPSRWVEKELRRIRQSNPQKQWEPNDMNDVTALSIAIPYCNVVVTERSWTGMVNTQKVNKPSGTTVLRDLRQLPELLASAAA